MLSLFKQMFKANPCKRGDSGEPTEPEEKQPDISKPVRELVAYILDRKNRWKVEISGGFRYGNSVWSIGLQEIDSRIEIITAIGFYPTLEVAVEGWELTQDEEVYIYESLKARYDVVMGRLERYRKSVRKRKQQEERDRVTVRLKELGYEE